MSTLTQLEAIAGTLTDNIVNLVEQRPILVIYPRHRAHIALLSLILPHLPDQVYSYALQSDDTSLEMMLTHLMSNAEFPAGLGEQTRNALHSSSVPEDWAEAFGSDLSKLPGKFVLVLDEMDRLQQDADSLKRFFLELPHYLPKQGKLIINGRKLHRQPWNDLVLAEHAQFIGADYAVETAMLPQPPERGQIEFYSLSGHARIISDGRTITSWDGVLPRNLCYFFLDHPLVTRDEIFETFWPHLGIKEATNVFHVTKRKISEKLGYEITAYSNGFYIPSPRVNISYDAREFETVIEEALAGPAELAPAKWYRAVQLYRHPYLAGSNMPWMVEKRERLRDNSVQALTGLGRMQQQLRQPDQALIYLLRALVERPVREDIHREVMTLYYELGQITNAIAQYKVLEGLLKVKLSLNPSPETRTLYDLYRSGKGSAVQ